jgi:hypothetical protein
MNLKCITQGHVYRELSSATPMEILDNLIENDFVYDMLLDKGVTKQVHWLADYYRREYGNIRIANLKCIRCGCEDRCIDQMKKKMEKRLSSFLYRPTENLEEAST